MGDRVITASEVRIAVELARLDHSAVELVGPEGLDPELWWLDQVTLRQLAGDGEVYQPSSGEVRERVERLVEAAAEEDALDRLKAELGVDRTGIDAWVYNRLVVERFVLRNLGVGALDAARAEATYAGWLEDLARTVARRRIARVGQARDPMELGSELDAAGPGEEGSSGTDAPPADPVQPPLEPGSP